MSDQGKPNATENELRELLESLTTAQIEFVIARNETETDKEAARTIGLSEGTVKGWNKTGAKQTIDRAVQMMKYDGVITAMELRRRNLARAMAVKVAGLDSRDERVRQSVATEIIEGMLGKAEQTSNVKGSVTLNVPEYCVEQVKVMLDWLQAQVKVVIEKEP